MDRSSLVPALLVAIALQAVHCGGDEFVGDSAETGAAGEGGAFAGAAGSGAAATGGHAGGQGGTTAGHGGVAGIHGGTAGVSGGAAAGDSAAGGAGNGPGGAGGSMGGAGNGPGGAGQSQGGAGQPQGGAGNGQSGAGQSPGGAGQNQGGDTQGGAGQSQGGAGNEPGGQGGAAGEPGGAPQGGAGQSQGGAGASGQSGAGGMEPVCPADVGNGVACATKLACDDPCGGSCTCSPQATGSKEWACDPPPGGSSCNADPAMVCSYPIAGMKAVTSCYCSEEKQNCVVESAVCPNNKPGKGDACASFQSGLSCPYVVIVVPVTCTCSGQTGSTKQWACSP